MHPSILLILPTRTFAGFAERREKETGREGDRQTDRDGEKGEQTSQREGGRKAERPGR